MPLLWFMHIVVLALLSWRFLEIHRNSPSKPYFWYGLLARITAGILFGLFYKFYYQGGDTWNFYQSAKVLASWMPVDPKSCILSVLGGSIPDQYTDLVGYQDQPRALWMVRIVSLLILLTGDSYWLSSAYLSLFAFFGLWTLVERISSAYPDSKKAALMAFIFLPSVLFWGSGISKETIFLGGFGFLVAWFWPYFSRGNHLRGLKPHHWLFAGIMVFLLLQLKYYYMAVLLPVLIATIIESKMARGTEISLRRGRWLLIFGALIFAGSWLHLNLRPDYVVQLIHDNAQVISAKTSPAAAIDFFDHASPMVWVWINSPWAILTGLFRPNLGDWGSVFQTMAIVEHLLLLIFTLGQINSLRQYHWKSSDWLPCLTYVLILAAFLTLSTPNFGTLVRYKVSFLPVFILLILYKNAWWERMEAKLHQACGF